MASQALYLLKVPGIQNPERELVRDDFLDKGLLSILSDSNWRRHLAALYFNVKPDRAFEILSKTEAEELLSQGNVEEFSKLKEAIPGLAVVCEGIVEQNHLRWAREEPISIANCAITIDAVDLEDSLTQNLIWEFLIKGALQLSWKLNITEEVGLGAVKILVHTSGKSRTQVIRNYLDGISNAVRQEEEVDTEQVENWVKAVIHLVKAVHEMGNEQVLRDQFRIPGPPDFYILVMAALSKSSAEQTYQSYFLPELEIEDVASHLAELCAAGLFEETAVLAVEVMSALDLQVPWESVVEAIAQRLRATDIQSVEIRNLLSASFAMEYAGYDGFEEVLENLTSQGFILHHLHKAQSENAPRAAARCVLVQFEHRPEGIVEQNVGESATGLPQYKAIVADPESAPDVTKELFSLSLRFNKIEVWLMNGENSQISQTIVNWLLERLVREQNVEKFITPALFIQYQQYLLEHLLEDSCDNLITRLITNTNLVSMLLKTGFSLEYGQVYLKVLEQNQTHTDYAEFLVNGLRSDTLDKKAWLEELRQDGPFLGIAATLANQKVEVGLQLTFHDALLEFTGGLYGEEESPELGVKGTTLLRLMADHLEKQFLEALIDRAEETNKAVLTIFGDAMLNSQVFEQRANDVVRRLYTEIVKARSPSELQWMDQALQKRPAILTAADPSSLALLKDRVASALKKALDDDIETSLQSIATQLELKLPKDQTTDETNTETQSDDVQ